MGATQASVTVNDRPEDTKTQGGNNERWRAIVVVVGAVCAGAALAVGHDRFNNSFHNKQVDHASLSQQWITRIGSGFAFLVKTFLASAVAVSYTQRLWRNLRARAYKVENVDVFMAASTDFLSFFQPQAWFRTPGLWIMGLTMWCIPLAAVITPGTVTVVYRPSTNITDLQVPQLSWNSSTWSEYGPTSASFEYWGASPAVQRAGFAAATTGEVLNVPHTFINETYHLDFSGPALQCSTANETIRNRTQTNVNRHWGSGGYYQFWSWVGDDDHGLTSTNSSAMDLELTNTWSTLDTTSPDAARIFVYSATGQVNGMYPFMNVSECVLYNASYSVDFVVQEDSSVATVTNLVFNEKLAGLSHPTSNLLGLSQRNESVHYAYQSVMDAFGKLLVGYAFAQNAQATAYYTSFQRLVVDWDTLESTQRDLETMFQNFTLSMFSSSDLILNSTQAATVPVTVMSYPLVYRYEPQDLWISYGAALVVTLVAAAVGLEAVWTNGASYSAKFSTSVRVVKNTGLDRMLDIMDNGSDPRPKVLGEARMQIDSGKRLLTEEVY